MKIQKTNAMRILDSKQLSYEVLSYAHGKEAVAGLDVAKQLEENPEQVSKSLGNGCEHEGIYRLRNSCCT